MTYQIANGIKLLVLATALLIPAAGLSQVIESEPNDTCDSAQWVGPLQPLPLIVAGDLETVAADEQPQDVDFYAFEAEPGMLLRVELNGQWSGGGSAEGLLVGLFDSGCSLLNWNDSGYYFSLDPRLFLHVPADGIFYLAATGYDDIAFDGSHSSEGSYEIGLFALPDDGAVIFGRVVNAVTGEPISGSMPPFGNAGLFRCDNTGCTDWIEWEDTDGMGGFVFYKDGSGEPLTGGDYAVEADTDEVGYLRASVGPFAVGDGERFDVGDIGLWPGTVAIANVMPCADIGAEGGECRFSFDVHFRGPGMMSALVWTTVHGIGAGSQVEETRFTAKHERTVQIPALSSRNVSFRFEVPADVADGVSLCVEGWVSKRETSYFGTVQHEDLFCMTKQDGVFETLSPTAAARLLREAR
jgi:hypothetical protein